MKSLFFSALLLLASASVSFAQNQSPVAADFWLDEPATAATAEAPRYNMGWNTAPGQSLSLHDRPSTDYWGRPLTKKAANRTTASQRAAAAQPESTDPMMHSSGLMIAPGMNSAPFRRVSTDYWGRPLKSKTTASSALAKKVETAKPVAATTVGSW